MIIQKVAQELQSIKRLVEAQQIEIKILKRQLKGIKIKLEVLMKELGFFRAKKQKSSQYLSKYALEIKNQAQFIKKRKNPENLAETIKEKVYLIVIFEDKETISTLYVSSIKNMQKQNYILVVVTKLA